MRYQFLGPFDVFDDQGQSLALGGERQRALLALLVLHANQVVSTDRIVDSLWSEDPPGTAGNVIQVYVSRLRRALEPSLEKGEKPGVLLTRRPGYLLRVLDGEVDAVRFTERAATGRAALESGSPGLAAAFLKEALDLWQGDPLADLAYEPFAVGTAARLAEERVGALEDLMEARLALGDHVRLVPELEQLVDGHPFRERFWSQLMLASYRSGRQADALRAYRQAAEALLDQLGIDPGPELQKLERQILNQDPSLELEVVVSVPEPNQIPLIGRARHIAALKDAVALTNAGGTVVVRLIGDRGAGLTRLIDEAETLARDAGLQVHRATALESEPVGWVADQILEQAATPSALLIQSAQLADPTSIGRIRQRLAGGVPTLVVLAQSAVSGRPGRALDQLATAGSATVVELPVTRITRADLADVTKPEFGEWLFEHSDGDPFELGRLLDTLQARDMIAVSDSQIDFTASDYPDDLAPPLGAQVAGLEAPDRLVVEACAVANSPLPLRAVGSLVGRPSLEAVDLVDRLVAGGFLEESDRGITLSGALASGRLLERLGATRRAAVAEAVIDAWQAHLEPSDDAAFGLLAERAARHEVAADKLMAAALRAMLRQNLSVAQPLLEGAVRSMTAIGEETGPRWGRAHLALAECHRLAGWPDLAASALERAIVHTTGVENVDAWGWAAQVASDRQQPTDAEWRAAVGQHQAIHSGEPAKAASLLSLQARVLNRIGFPDEADYCSGRSQAVLAQIGAPQQKFLASYNQAWIDFDRGRARAAEARFARLIEKMPDHTDARRADILAWQARSLYRVGRVDEAGHAADEAVALGLRTGDIGPVFLAFMARAEGATMYWHGPDATEAANEMLGLVLQQLPAWENAARFLLAKAHLASGSLGEAADEAANAVDACPDGSAGRRWLLACRALVHIVSSAQGQPVEAASEEIIHEMLGAQWHEAAIDLLIAKGERGEPGRATQAATYAVDLGLASAAGRAVSVAKAQGESLDSLIVDGADRLVRSALRTMPPSWADRFRLKVVG